MTVVNRTRLKQRALDRQRARHVGATTRLTLLSYEQVGNNSTLATIKDGWAPTQTTDPETSLVEVLIAEQVLVTKDIMKSLDRFSILNTTYRIVRGGITPPFAQPRVWKITGEEIRA